MELKMKLNKFIALISRIYGGTEIDDTEVNVDLNNTFLDMDSCNLVISITEHVNRLDWIKKNATQKITALINEFREEIELEYIAGCKKNNFTYRSPFGDKNESSH